MFFRVSRVDSRQGLRYRVRGRAQGLGSRA